MKSLQAYFNGWSALFRYKWMWLIMYISNFLLAFLAAIPVSGFLGNTVGHSLSLERSLEGFDFVFLSELYIEYGEIIRVILNQSLLFISMFLILSIFLMGGVLTILKKDQERFRMNVFLKGCTEYFWRLFRLTFYFLIIQAFVLAVFFFLFSSSVNGFSPFAMESEKQLIDAFKLLAPLYILIFTIIAMIQDYTKIHLVHQNPSFLFSTFLQSFKMVIKNFGRFFFLYLLNLFTLLLSYGIYHLLKGMLDTSTMTSVFLTFLLMQFFIIARIGIKILNLSSATYLYKRIGV